MLGILPFLFPSRITLVGGDYAKLLELGHCLGR
jgi:hypothetical protein